jgi:hypothetical protein
MILLYCMNICQIHVIYVANDQPPSILVVAINAAQCIVWTGVFTNKGSLGGQVNSLCRLPSLGTNATHASREVTANIRARAFRPSQPLRMHHT